MGKLALVTSCIFKRAHAARGEESQEKDRDVESFAAEGGTVTIAG